MAVDTFVEIIFDSSSESWNEGEKRIDERE